MAITLKTTSLLLALSLAVLGNSVNARLLDNDEAKAADLNALQTEARLFSTIRMGIALSMAQCHNQTDCTPSVNAEEVQRLLDTLNTRIDEMTLRQEEVENPDAYQQVLALYTGERDNYSGVLEQLDTLEADIEAIGKEDDVEQIEDTGLEDILTEETEVIIQEEEEELTGLDEFIDETANELDSFIEEDDFTELDEFLDVDVLDVPVDSFDATEF